jgi:hypothetical protein
MARAEREKGFHDMNMGFRYLGGTSDGSSFYFSMSKICRFNEIALTLQA